jgi:hypothetical protein
MIGEGRREPVIPWLKSGQVMALQVACHFDKVRIYDERVGPYVQEWTI